MTLFLLSTMKISSNVSVKFVKNVNLKTFFNLDQGVNSMPVYFKYILNTHFFQVGDKKSVS